MELHLQASTRCNWEDSGKSGDPSSQVINNINEGSPNRSEPLSYPLRWTHQYPPKPSNHKQPTSCIQMSSASHPAYLTHSAATLSTLYVIVYSVFVTQVASEASYLFRLERSAFRLCVCLCVLLFHDYSHTHCPIFMKFWINVPDTKAKWRQRK